MDETTQPPSSSNELIKGTHSTEAGCVQGGSPNPKRDSVLLLFFF